MEPKDKDSSLFTEGKENPSAYGSTLNSTHHQAIQVLVEKNQLLETNIDYTLSMIAVVDREFRCLISNKTIQEYTGLSRQDAVGKKVFDVFKYLRDSDVEKNINLALAGEMIVHGPVDSLFQDGRIFDTMFL